MVADPVLDIAFTLMLSTIPFKHLAPSLGMDVSALDFERFADQYLRAYRAERAFDGTHLEYYRTMRCVRALMEGAQGQAVWQYPPIVKELREYIQSITGISIEMPDT
jgi:hypothetical protein